ncbi:hypothetical protein DV738_g1352, partial [Chaetothyriales sp. CBS 135597]
MTTKYGGGWSLVILFTLNLILLQIPPAKTSPAAPSVVDVGNYASRNHEIDVFLSHRNLDDPLVQKATLIIKTKLAGSTGLQDAAAKLIKTCTTMAGGRSSSSVGAKKEMAQQIYAIKATDYTIASAACTQELFKVDNLWTSYTNHLQDARTLCEVGSAEHAPKAMLELLSDMAESVPPIVEMLKDAVTRQQELRDQMQKGAEEAEARHRDRLREEEELHVASMQRANEIFGALQRHASQLETGLRSQLLHANEDVNAVSKALQGTMTDLLTLRDTATLLLQQYLSGFEEVRVSQSQSIDSIERNFMSSMRSMDLAAGGVLDQFQALSAGVRTGMVDISEELQSIAQRQHEMSGLQEGSKLQLLEALSVGQRVNDAVSAIDGKIGGVLLVIEACESLLQRFSLHKLLAGVGVVVSALLLRLVWSAFAGAVFFLFCVSAAAAPAVWASISPTIVIATSGIYSAGSSTTAFMATHTLAPKTYEKQS